MLSSTLTTLNPEDQELDPLVFDGHETETVASVGTSEYADSHEGAASDDDFPIGFVVIAVVLIVVAVVAMIAGFRSTRQKKESAEERRQSRPLP